MIVYMIILLLAHPMCLLLAMIVYTWANDVAGGSGKA